MLDRGKYVIINKAELEKLAENVEIFAGYLRVINGAIESSKKILNRPYGDNVRIKYSDNGKVEFQDKGEIGWWLIDKGINHVHYIKATLCKTKGGCKNCGK